MWKAKRWPSPRLTTKQARALGLVPPAEHKYHARRTVDASGVLFDSQAEFDYCNRLVIRHRDHLIRWWSHGPRFQLQAEPLITYRPDFIYIGANGHWVAVDVKGFQTAAFRLKVRLWKATIKRWELRIVKDGIEVPA